MIESQLAIQIPIIFSSQSNLFDWINFSDITLEVNLLIIVFSASQQTIADCIC